MIIELTQYSRLFGN